MCRVITVYKATPAKQNPGNPKWAVFQPETSVDKNQTKTNNSDRYVFIEKCKHTVDNDGLEKLYQDPSNLLKALKIIKRDKG